MNYSLLTLLVGCGQPDVQGLDGTHEEGRRIATSYVLNEATDAMDVLLDSEGVSSGDVIVSPIEAGHNDIVSGSFLDRSDPDQTQSIIVTLKENEASCEDRTLSIEFRSGEYDPSNAFGSILNNHNFTTRHGFVLEEEVGCNDTIQNPHVLVHGVMTYFDQDRNRTIPSHDNLFNSNVDGDYLSTIEGYEELSIALEKILSVVFQLGREQITEDVENIDRGVELGEQYLDDMVKITELLSQRELGYQCLSEDRVNHRNGYVVNGSWGGRLNGYDVNVELRYDPDFGRIDGHPATDREIKLTASRSGVTFHGVFIDDLYVEGGSTVANVSFTENGQTYYLGEDVSGEINSRVINRSDFLERQSDTLRTMHSNLADMHLMDTTATAWVHRVDEVLRRDNLGVEDYAKLQREFEQVRCPTR